eukprot:4016534-Heterocapsa_arctica.AAC.1
MEIVFTLFLAEAGRCDQVRAQLLERVHDCWDRSMEHDIYGTGLDRFEYETATRKERGGAQQVAVFAQIHKIKIEIHAYGMAEQVLDGGGDGQEVITVRI